MGGGGGGRKTYRQLTQTNMHSDRWTDKQRQGETKRQEEKEKRRKTYREREPYRNMKKKRKKKQLRKTETKTDWIKETEAAYTTNYNSPFGFH